MSFADNFGSSGRKGTSTSGGFDLEAFNGPSSRGKQNGDGLSSTITNELRQLSSNVSLIENLTRQIGTSKDGTQLRDQLNTIIGNTRDLCKTATDNVRKFDSNRTNTDRLTQQKLTKDLQFWVQRYQDAYKIASDKERSTPIPQPSSSPSTSSSSSSSKKQRQIQTFPGSGDSYPYDDSNDDIEKQGLIDANRREEQYRMQSQVSFNNNIILDRERDIREIEKNVIEVNEIFRDLSALVVEQGSMIDSIESNIESSVEHTSKGAEELVKASKYQKSSRNKLCCLLLIITVIVAALGLFVWLFVMRH